MLTPMGLGATGACAPCGILAGEEHKGEQVCGR